MMRPCRPRRRLDLAVVGQRDRDGLVASEMRLFEIVVCIAAANSGLAANPRSRNQAPPGPAMSGSRYRR